MMVQFRNILITLGLFIICVLFYIFVDTSSFPSYLLLTLFLLTVEVLLYSPDRPVVDFSATFLWLMAVFTIVIASIWPEYIAREQVDERYNQLTRKVFFTLYDPFIISVSNISNKFFFSPCYLFHCCRLWHK